jgi:glycosyltransferase involved in cell wall biosynthesis
VSDLLRACDLFVFPTLAEGQPFALMEAMAHGLPIVTTDASGIPEILSDGHSGVLCPKGDSCALYRALRLALRDPGAAKTMARNARQRAENLDEREMLQDTLQLIQETGA